MDTVYTKIKKTVTGPPWAHIMRGFMKEKDLRKWHRNLGIILAFFIILQAVTGLLITIKETGVPHSHAGKTPVIIDEAPDELEPAVFQSALAVVHHGGGSAGTLYRIILSIGIMGMAFSGILIYLKIRTRNSIFRKNSSRMGQWAGTED
jgi:uncharacterized iron-regulated membrane protein